MTTSTSGIILTMVLIAVTTLLCRSIPFIAFGGKRGVPKIVTYLGDVLPAAIMVILVIYCLKDVDVKTAYFGLPELVTLVLVLGIHIWRKNTVLSVVSGTLIYMVLIRTIFPMV